MSVLSLMTDDVIFMVPGREPFGKQDFAEDAKGMKSVRIDGMSDVLEVQVFGNWAYLRNHIAMTATPLDGGPPVHRSGYTLTVMHKEDDGHWRVARDANLVA